jgi:hypothetical protein
VLTSLPYTILIGRHDITTNACLTGVSSESHAESSSASPNFYSFSDGGLSWTATPTPRSSSTTSDNYDDGLAFINTTEIDD